MVWQRETTRRVSSKVWLRFCLKIMSSYLVLLFTLLLCGVNGDESNSRIISALWYGPGQHQLVEGVHESAAVIGNFRDDIATTGWSYLSITDVRKDRVSVPDSAVAHLAGWVELNLTVSLVEMQWENTMADYCSQKIDCAKIDDFLAKNKVFMDRGVKSNTDPLWYQLGLFEMQLTGMYDAYKQMGRTTLPSYALRYFQLHDETDDLATALNPAPNSSSSSAAPVPGSGSCSALIKVLPGNSDLFVGHDTWTSFANMLRIFKRYELHYQTNKYETTTIPGHTQVFPSYPGRLYSGDDYYLISSGLVTMETSLEIDNPNRWKFVNPECIFENRRVVLANRLAKTTSDWDKTFRQFNSGTYNNEWMILDYKLFEPSADLKDGLLWVLEQVPGMVNGRDLTYILREKTYWASYNIPYFDDINILSGNDKMIDKYGDWFSWTGAPRAKIFARDHVKVTNISSLVRLMKYNDFQHDELARCNCTPPYSAENAIAARSDLNPASGTYPFSALGHRLHGAIDMKVTSYAMFQDSLTCVAYSGPTFQQQPVFQWSTSGSAAIPQGHPDKWDFEDVKVQWSSSTPGTGS